MRNDRNKNPLVKPPHVKPSNFVPPPPMPAPHPGPFVPPMTAKLVNAIDVVAGDGITVEQGVIQGMTAFKVSGKQMVGTDGVSQGESGSVPAPAPEDAGKFLSAEGKWVKIDVGDNVEVLGGENVTVDKASEEGKTTYTVNAEVPNFSEITDFKDEEYVVIVPSYSKLCEYDTSDLDIGNLGVVIQDETHENKSYIYKYIGEEQWEPVGPLTEIDDDPDTINYVGETVLNKIKIAINNNLSKIIEEKNRASSEEDNLQNQIDIIKMTQNCVDVVETYADLMNLDTSSLEENNKVIVISDETHDNVAYVWKLEKQGESFVWAPVGAISGVSDSWKQWSKNNGSSGPDANVVYVGKDNVVTDRDNTLVMGTGNTVSTEGEVEYGDTDVVSIGTSNTATNAANAYQFGRENTVTGTDVADEGSAAINIGIGNTSDATGLNIGKNNESHNDGHTFGESNYATDGSYSIGKANTTFGDAYAFGRDNTAGVESADSDRSFAAGVLCEAYENSVAIGNYSDGHENSIVIGTDSSSYKNSISIGTDTIADDNGIAIGNLNNATDKSISIGIESDSTTNGVAIGTSTYAENTSVAIGSNDYACGKSIVIGDNNGTVVDNGGHATIIGYDNESMSNTETINFNPPLPDIEPTNVPLFISSSYNHGKRTDQILWHTELKKGKIKSISYTFSFDPSVPISNRHVQIYLKHITQYSFGGVQYSSVWIKLTPDNLVYDNTVSITPNEPFKFVFDCDFDYNGTDNLCISFCDITQQSLSLQSFQQPAFKTSDKRLQYSDAYHNVIDPCDMNTTHIGYFRDVLATQTIEIQLDGDSTVSELIVNREIKPGLTGNIDTDSIILGNLNISRHYSSILFGVGNESKEPVILSGHTDTSDDDGFMLAIGRENIVGRNYDIAIGYKSIANGGENIALQHSTAIGYKNLAMFGSNAEGIDNIYIKDSSIDIEQKERSFEYYARNLLIDTKLNIQVGNLDGTSYGLSTLAGNMFRICNGTLKTQHLNNNWVFGLQQVNIECKQFNENFIFDRQGSFNTTNVYSFDRNIMLCPSSLNFDSIYTVSNNIFVNSSVTQYKTLDDTIGHYYYNFDRNTILHGSINTNEHRILDNIVLNHSRITGELSDALSKDLSWRVCEGNILFKSVFFINDHQSEHPREIPSPNNNFIFGTVAENITNCFSFSDPGGFDYDLTEIHSIYKGVASAQLVDCVRTVNFGDNNTSYIASSCIFGESNIFSGFETSFVFARSSNLIGSRDVQRARQSENASWCLVYGDYHKLQLRTGDKNIHNTVIGNNDYIIVQDGYSSYNTLIGQQNIIYAGNDTVSGNPTLNMAIGNYNVISSANGTSSNFIFGTYNRISADPATKFVAYNQEQINSITDTDIVEFIPTEDRLSVHHIIGQYGVVTTLTGGKFYQYRYGYICDVTSSRPREYTTISGMLFAEGVLNKTLNNNETYYITSTYTSSEKLYTYELINNSTINTGKVYHYKNGFVQNNPIDNGIGIELYRANAPTVESARNVIFGSSNTIYDHIDNYTLIGSNNIVFSIPEDDSIRETNPSFAISNGFVQGNNNIAKFGSNIVSMGNGNVSIGHNSVAIGNQLISDQWQTVLGKYNTPIDGPDRLTLGNDEPTKALLIIGNGYSEKDDSEWQNEEYIHRSNAMVVYADGTVKARKFVADEPAQTLIEGNGIELVDDPTTNTVTINVAEELAELYTLLCNKPKVSGKSFIIQSSGTEGTLEWVEYEPHTHEPISSETIQTIWDNNDPNP